MTSTRLNAARTSARYLLCLTLLGAAACRGDAGSLARQDGTQSGKPDTLHVTILGRADDPRVPFAREALHHWNAHATRLGLNLRVDTATVISRSVPAHALSAASRAMAWRALGVLRLRAALTEIPGDIIIALSDTDLISFGVSTGTGRVGVVGLRPADHWPLSLPNTARNVIAHELGHVLGLEHNADSTRLMCGRPAPCRPATFASVHARFFPLTDADEQLLRTRWR